jgi:hypothetical protein
MFLAPRGYFDYWIDFMRRHGTVDEEYFELHSFMACGITGPAGDVVIMDNTTESHEFQPFVVPWRAFAAGYVRDPDRWFLDCVALDQRRHEPDFAGFAAKYQTFVEDLHGGFEIYDMVADSFAAERAVYPESYRVPSINSLALLAGGRDFFCRFLRHTSHAPQVKRAFAANARLIVAVLHQASQYHANMPGVSPDEIRRRLQLLRVHEERAVRLLKEDLLRSGVTFPGIQA